MRPFSQAKRYFTQVRLIAKGECEARAPIRSYMCLIKAINSTLNVKHDSPNQQFILLLALRVGKSIPGKFAAQQESTSQTLSFEWPHFIRTQPTSKG